jgi:CBS domain-containing protein
MNTVGMILKKKGSQVWTAPAKATVEEALKVMVEKRVSAVMVIEAGRVAGIFTERDFTHRLGVAGLDPGKVRLEEVMTRELVTVDPHTSVNTCMILMTERRVRHLPVMEAGELTGIISIGDVLKDLIEELQFMVDQLENYIQGLR